MKRSLFLILFLFVFQVFSQDIQTIDGKKFYVHQVEKGNTLYSVSTKYGVSISDILNNNPEAEKGIKIGQNLYIPVVNAKEVNTSPAPVTNGVLDGKALEDSVKLTRFHIVSKQETLTGIAKLYAVSPTEIIKLNPGVDAGVKIGQRLVIPDAGNKSADSKAKTVVFYDTIIPHKVAKTETLYSISKRYMIPQKEIMAYNGIKTNTIQPESILYIPLKKEVYKPVEIRDVSQIKIEEKPKLPSNDFVFKKKDSYKVVIALPLGLSNTSEKFGTIATEFYMGAEYALDSLQKLGLNADVYVVDCSGDTTVFKTKLNTHKDADLLIGPFLGASMDVAARFCEINKIKIVNPLVGYTAPLKGNEFLTNAMTSDISLIEGLAAYLSKQAVGKIILVKPTANDMLLYNAFRNKLQILNAQNNIKFIECELADFPTYLAKGMNTTIVFPSREANAVTKFMNTLHQNNVKIGSGEVNVYGTKEWTSMNRVKNYYKNTYNFHFAMANDLDYKDANVIRFHNGFRQKYTTDLTKIAAQGFDVAFYFISRLLMDKEPKNLLMNDFSIRKISTTDGFENVATYIYKQIDFEYILQDKVK